jgi:hypothetical protein
VIVTSDDHTRAIPLRRETDDRLRARSCPLLGAGTGASEIQIWTDVDGMRGADPRGHQLKKRAMLRELRMVSSLRQARNSCRIGHASQGGVSVRQAQWPRRGPALQKRS